MKAKKIIVGAMSAAMLSLAVCPVAPVSAANDTVQITVGSVQVGAGEEFSVDVKLSDIPAAGIQVCNFSLKFDNSLITVDSVTAGTLTETGASENDPTASLLPNFNFNADNSSGLVNVMWSTSLDDSSYWLKGEGVFCTIKGKTAEGASGTANIEVVATDRETYSGSGVGNTSIDVGYFNGSSTVRFDSAVTNGSVVIGNSGTTNPDDTTIVKGDANCDGKLTLADTVAVLQYIANKEKYPMSNQGILNADVDGVPGLSGMDALTIQKADSGSITL